MNCVSKHNLKQPFDVCKWFVVSCAFVASNLSKMMELMEEDIPHISPEIQKKALDTALEILPQKSVQKYNRQYEIFMDWCKKHEIKKYSENVLLAYFSDLSKEYSPSSMWSFYSMVFVLYSLCSLLCLNKML